jgi:hypothetical protein
MLDYSSYRGLEPPLRRLHDRCGETPSPLDKLLLNSRENAVGSQTPRAYLLELASVAPQTLASLAQLSESGRISG